MQGLNSLSNMMIKKGEEFVKELLNKYVVINEKLNGSYFAVKLNSVNEYEFFKKTGEITFADRILNKFYNRAIRHFENLAEETKLSLPDFYVYCFEYFPDKSRLVLSHIHEVDQANKITRTLQSKKLLESWARTLLVEDPPIFYEGRLSQEQKFAIMEFVYTQDQETSKKLHTKTFSDFLGETLGISNKDIEGLVFRFYESEIKDESTVNVLKLIDPDVEALIDSQEKHKPKQKADDFIWLILIDLMNYIESLDRGDILSMNLKETHPQLKYVELINALYLRYMRDNGDKWDGLEIRVPDYLTKDEFSLNSDLIEDQKVRELIESQPVHKEIYKVLLNTFRNPNIKVSSTLFSDTMKYNLKAQVERLSHLILHDNTNESYFTTFYDFVGH